jgi:hypothetical protein
VVISIGKTIVAAGGLYNGIVTNRCQLYQPTKGHIFSSDGTLSVARDMIAAATLSYWVIH